MIKKAPFLDLQTTLNRIAALTGAKTDTAIAAELDVSPQTLSTWKNRRKIPFEQLCGFAQRRNISLDFLLLGKKETKARIDPDLFKGIRQQLGHALSEAEQIVNNEEIDNYTLDFYNEAILFDDPLQRMRTITRSIVLVSREKLKELIKHLEWHVQNFEKFAPGRSMFPELKGIEDAQKKLNEVKRRVEEFDAFLRSPSAQSLDDIRRGIVATKPEATRTETSRSVTSRDTVARSAKKKKRNA